MKTRLLLSFVLLFVFVLPLSAQDDDIKLTQDHVYTLESGESLIVSYPENWEINDDPRFIRLSNNLDLIENALLDLLESGDILIEITTFSFDALEANNITPSDDLVEMLTSYAQSIIIDSEIERLRIGSRDIVTVDWLFDDFNVRVFGLLFDDLFIIINGATAVGELDQNSDIMNAIVGSIDVATQPVEVIDADDDSDDTTIVLSDTVTIDDTEGGALSINYPVEWFTEISDGSLVISNSETGLGLDLSDGSLVESGEIALGILPIPEELMALLIEPDIELTVESALEGFSVLLLEDPSLGIDVGEIALRDIGFIETAYATGNLMVDNEPLQDVQFMTLLANGGYVLLVIVADSNEMDDWQGLIDDMIRSIEYTAP